jgi:TetR/AcrR family transcriptional repressor of nem operon
MPVAGTDSGTRERALDIAEDLLQRRGFNGFSYADVAGALQLSKAALHYHFATKAALGEALVARYRARFLGELAAGDRGGGRAALDAFVETYARVLRDDRMCLCGMLAAEVDTLPVDLRMAVSGFFDEVERWLAGALGRGRADGSLAFPGEPLDAARMIVDTLEGAVLVARSDGGTARFTTTARRLVAVFTDAGGAST